MLILTDAAAGGQMNPILTFLIPLVIFFVIIYFLMIRPEKKRQRQVADMQGNVQKNDKIVTIGGIYGIVDDVKENIVTIIIASGARMKIDQTAIKGILNREVEEPKKEGKTEEVKDDKKAE